MQPEEVVPVGTKDEGESVLTCYEVLEVHPAAPLELITAAYWRLAGEVQTRRSADPLAEAELHQYTRSYQILTNHETRAEYDSSVGIAEQSLAPNVPSGRRGGGLFGGKKDTGDSRVDYYEILRIIPTAKSSIVQEAYSTLKTYYVRLVLSDYSPQSLLMYLDEAYSVISDPERRTRYDEERSKAAKPAPVKPTVAASVAPKTVAKVEEKAKQKPKPEKKKPVKVTKIAVPAAGVTVRKQDGGSPFKAVGAITGAFGAMGRQLGNLSRREQARADEVLSSHETEVFDPSEAETELLQRISSSVEAPEAPVEEPRAIGRLTVVDGPLTGESFELRHFPLSLGGDEACDVRLPGLASNQARLLHRDGRFVVYNLAADSENGDAEPWWVLESGEDLTLGPYRLRFDTAG
jgi:curved DNA-binding protein CbpA